MQKQLFVMVLVSGLVGCQSHIRPYDGVIGYQIQSQQPMQLVFTDEDRFGWAVMQQRAHQSCAKALGQSVEKIGVVTKQQHVVQQSINILSAIPVPTTVSASSTSSGNASLNGGRQHLKMQHTNITAVDAAQRPFKQLTVECQPKS